MKKIAQPLTVSGLLKKRGEITRFLTRLDSERHSVLESLARLDATLDLFISPHIDLGRYKPPELVNQAEFKSFIVALFRQAGRPISLTEAGEAWLIHRGLERNRINLGRARCRMHRYFMRFAEYGILEMVKDRTPLVMWEMVNEFPHD
jgi:hypothetical protein